MKEKIARKILFIFIGFYHMKFNDVEGGKGWNKDSAEQDNKHWVDIFLSFQLSVYSVIIIWNNIYFLILCTRIMSHYI